VNVHHVQEEPSYSPAYEHHDADDERSVQRAEDGAELNAWYAEVFPGTSQLEVQQQQGTRPTPAAVDLDDDEVIERGKRGKHGSKFARLWAGDTSDYHGDESRADMALCSMLAISTGKDPERMDRLFRRSGLMRMKWERRTYRERTLQQAIASTSATYTPGRRSRSHVESTVHGHDWQHRTETPYQRNRELARTADAAREQVEQHFEAKSATPLVIALQPGVGKSHAIAELGRACDVAWISERHNMCESVPALKEYYRPIVGCKAENCPDYILHAALVAKGRNTWPLHKAHMCAYYAYMLPD
jgi:hypothetical protein